jgi:hypothetical protein
MFLQILTKCDLREQKHKATVTTTAGNLMHYTAEEKKEKTNFPFSLPSSPRKCNGGTVK